MAKRGKGKIHTVSIIIQWREEDAEVADNPKFSNIEATSRSQQHKNAAVQDDRRRSIPDKKLQSPHKRLLPSDRIVLEALRACLPRGEQVTTPVRTRELIDACEISRRQVQICLRRLNENGLIKRILDGTRAGQQDGYQYQILEDTSSG